MSVLEGGVLQLFPGVNASDLVTLVWIGFFALTFLYQTRIQSYLALSEISRGLNKLKVMKDKARKDTIDYLVNVGKATNDPSPRVDQFLDYVAIMPVDMDPAGIVGKIDHIVTTNNDRVRAEVGALLNQNNPVTVSISENLLEVATSLNQIHKIVRHYYLLGKKTNSYFTLVQLQMLMPMIIQEADALLNAVDSFKLGQPVGDGIGPIVVSRFMAGKEKRVIAKDTVMAITEYKGRKLYVLKADGPMAYVGQPGVAIQKIVGEMGVKPSAIVMIDAALKLEGEKTGEIAEGVGAAIGGIGVEKFQIEEAATRVKVPLYAILVKQSILEAITVMRKEIAEAADKVTQVLNRVIEEKTKEGDEIVVAGIGNTLGVAQ
ncbi:MAG: DUF1512 domain-containing protein [Nitrososphaerota archaeon]|jgi:hypothetical protein|nr:DUF1512 domain-containing protein [Nitrososphaerota archaeon]MDG6903339.1 DUF1512 domain-containing protein [Nitrososphaerota archaeon]MDG6911799.1 DUF1512 domain-containing protein [Nitrososphaerota archaeon]MDG6940719.1 DUF1512 domain-containing protein [Nitrososphaerota archaeon]MDG6945676.1 DUF1512 domain-containing protein [Nitrososphaerota archaeon]